MATVEQKRKWLAEAEIALHDLQMGRAVRVLVDQSGERIEYTLTNHTRLMGYIETLKRELGIIAPTRPMGFWL